MSKRDLLTGSRGGSFFHSGIIKILSIFLLTVCLLAQTAISLPGDFPEVHADSPVFSVTYPITHRHTGSEGSGGGCYSVSHSGTRDIEVPCGGTLYYWGDEWGTSECDRCGASYFGDCSGQGCPHSETRSESYTYYSLGCGRSSGQVVGYVTYTKDTDDWVKEVTATVSYENHGMGVASDPYYMNGQRNSDGVFTITENGNYTLSLVVDGNSSVTPCTITVNNVDHYGPSVIDYHLDPSDWTTEDVTVTLDEIADLQPNGTEGCGLCDDPISYDGGETWTSDTSHTYQDNGTYSILLKDNLDNITDYPVTIGNIDREPPRILKFEYDHTKNIRSLVIEVECDDVLSDGRNGVGLDDLPYSYDGGVTWTDETILELFENQTVEFRVRDKLGNTAELDEEITNIDCYPPTVTYTLNPSVWTNRDVTVTFHVADINADGTDGIGLPELYISYDGRKTWTDKTQVTRSLNGNITLSTRDLHDNMIVYSMDVTNIDKVDPSVSINIDMAEDHKYAVLTAEASDDASGIDEGSYVWWGPDGGEGKEIEVNRNGTYHVRVKDIAGNEAEASIEITDIDEIPDYVLEPTPAAVFNIFPNIHRVKSSSSNEAVVEEETLEEEVEIIPTPELAEADENIVQPSDNDLHRSLWDRFADWWNSLPLWLKIALTVLMIILLLGLILLFILWYRSVGIYSSTGERISVGPDEERYTFMGYKLIHTDDGHYTVTVPESIWNRAVTTSFKFTFNPLFAHIHKGEEVCISFPEDVVKTEHIERRIYVLVR